MINWDDILRDHGPAVWRTLYRVLGHRADVDECFQDTFLIAMESPKKQPVLNWSAWLTRVATNRAIDRLRHRSRTKTFAQPEILDSVPSSHADAGDALEHTERSAQLRKALTRLPAQQAEAISLHALLGWSYLEIADVLGVSSNAVGVMIHRAKNRLRELLEEPLGMKPHTNLVESVDAQGALREPVRRTGGRS